MEITSEYQLYNLEHTIGAYAKAIGKPVVYLRSYGWNNSSDVTKINASRDVYKEFLPIEWFNELDESEFSFVVLDRLGNMADFLQDTFPASQASVETEMYIYYALYNDEGQVIADNE